jgi:ABC-2 type transport system permease protein
MTGTVRLILRCTAFQARMLITFKFYLVAVFLQPLAFAFITSILLRHGHGAQEAGAVVVNTGLMGMWTAVLFGSGGALKRERAFGTLEHVVLAPTPLAVTVFAINLATAVLGLYSVAATALVGGLVFRLPVLPADPAAFLVALLVAVLANACLGFFLAATFVLNRNSHVLTNLLEYPVWLTAGLLVPVTLLPGWWQALGRLIPMTWSAAALRDAQLGHPVAADLLGAAGTALAYLALALLALRRVHDAARRRATLSLT